MFNFMLSLELKNKIKEYSLGVAPNESCGLLFQNNGKIDFFPCKNISKDKNKFFSLDPYDYLKVSRLGDIIGLVHSQQSGQPSELDLLISKVHNIKSYIYSLDYDKFIECGNSKLERYIGRPFEYGVNDCFSIVRDYYKNEYDIFINDYKRKEGWFEENPTIILDNFKKEGFIKVDVKNLNKGDLLLSNYKENDRPRHFMIYLGQNEILHHPRGRLSVIESLKDSQIRRISLVLRHKDIG